MTINCHDTALPLCQRVCEAHQRTIGDLHPYSIYNHFSLAHALQGKTTSTSTSISMISMSTFGVNGLVLSGLV